MSTLSASERAALYEEAFALLKRVQFLLEGLRAKHELRQKELNAQQNGTKTI